MKSYLRGMLLAFAPVVSSCIFFGLQDIPCKNTDNCPKAYTCIFNKAADTHDDIGVCYKNEQLAATHGEVNPDSACDDAPCCAQPPCRRMPDSSPYCVDASGQVDAPPSMGQDFAGQDCGYIFSGHNFKSLTFTENSWRSIDVIQDDRTGLSWEASPSQMSMQREDLRAYCESLYNHNGELAWRLPSFQELMTLVDYGRIDKALSAGSPRIPYDAFLYAAGLARANYVGQINFGEGQASIVAESQPLYPLCVFGDLAWSCPKQDELDDAADELEDRRSGLVWAKSEQGEVNWKQALRYCETLEVAAHADWRLPSAKEMAMLVDLGRRYDDLKVCPAIQQGLGWQSSAARDQQYWSSTPFVSNALHQAWAWDLNAGHLANIDISALRRARCVRTWSP